MAEITSNGSGGGPWDNASTWDGGIVPDLDVDTAIIAPGDSVSINVMLGDLTGKITNNGTLTVAVAGVVDKVPAGLTIATNDGTVTENSGTITANGATGTTTTNNGTVTDNSGIVTDNAATGVVTTNNLTVTANNGEVTENAATGTVATNNATVTANNGEVVANAALGEVTTNNLTVAANAGTVGTNSATGIVTANSGTVGTNEAGGEVTANTGTITANVGTVTANSGTVTTNTADVECTAAGIIVNQEGGTVTGDVVITSAWNITGGDFSGATSIRVNSTPATLDDSDDDLTFATQTVDLYAPFNVADSANTYTEPAAVRFRAIAAGYSVTVTNLAPAALATRAITIFNTADALLPPPDKVVRGFVYDGGLKLGEKGTLTMGNERKQKTAKTWKASGGTYALTLTSLANAAGRMGVKGDLGTVFPSRCVLGLLTKLAGAATPADTATIDVYWAPSPDNSNFPGKVSGADAALPATVADNVKQLVKVGSMRVTSSTGAQFQSWEFDPPTRYGVPVVVNNSGQAFSGTAIDHEVSVTPVL